MADLITYRIPTVADAEAIAVVHVRSMREAYASIVPSEVLANLKVADATERWQRYISAGDRAIVLAEAGREAVGFMCAGRLAEPLVAEADGHIFTLYVLKQHLRRGIGRRLLGRVSAEWLQRGGRTLSVGVLTENLPAKAFYESQGAQFHHPDTFEWDGHQLAESLYFFSNLAELSHFA